MTALLLALIGAYGVFLVYTGAALGWRGIGTGPAGTRAALLPRVALDPRRAAGLLGATATLFVVGAACTLALFAAPIAAVVGGAFAACLPTAAARAARHRRAAAAHESWPRMLEEMRVLTGSAGRSIPQALFEVGGRAPLELRPAFDAAHREWLLSTDFSRTLTVLKEALADPTADTVCETLLVAHELGGTNLDRRLEALAEDRLQELHGRKDARAKQAGVRFARRFVLIVPVGMAVVGLSVGTGRAAYGTPAGQLAVLVAIGVIAACWAWAGHLLRLPAPERVFRP
ncbi:MAG: type II secretion system F family protein [Acidimicrobiales bacterium]|nr:type II secretion system F family protein [Acidimicrobiales bacterium]